MREALRKQIEEKQKKKDLEKEMLKREELRDEIRVREEMKSMAIAEGMHPVEPNTAEPQAVAAEPSLRLTEQQKSAPLNPNLMAS